MVDLNLLVEIFNLQLQSRIPLAEPGVRKRNGTESGLDSINSMPLMFRSDRVCAVMFSQQGGPGRNPNEYFLSFHPPHN